MNVKTFAYTLHTYDLLDSYALQNFYSLVTTYTILRPLSKNSSVCYGLRLRSSQVLPFGIWIRIAWRSKMLSFLVCILYYMLCYICEKEAITISVARERIGNFFNIYNLLSLFIFCNSKSSFHPGVFKFRLRVFQSRARVLSMASPAFICSPGFHWVRVRSGFRSMPMELMEWQPR